MIALLNDKELGVQSAAARALGEIGDSQAVTPLLEKARAAEADPFVRRLSRQSLQQLGYRAPGDADGLNPVFLWAPGLALLAAGVGLGAVLGPFAVPIFLAGLVLLVLYFLRERGAGPSGDLAVDDDGSLSSFDGGGGGNGAPG